MLRKSKVAFKVPVLKCEISNAFLQGTGLTQILEPHRWRHGIERASFPTDICEAKLADNWQTYALQKCVWFRRVLGKALNHRGDL
jgi:hypothetical protein